MILIFTSKFSTDILRSPVTMRLNTEGYYLLLLFLPSPSPPHSSSSLTTSLLSSFLQTGFIFVMSIPSFCLSFFLFFLFFLFNFSPKFILVCCCRFFLLTPLLVFIFPCFFCPHVIFFVTVMTLFFVIYSIDFSSFFFFV